MLGSGPLGEALAEDELDEPFPFADVLLHEAQLTLLLLQLGLQGQLLSRVEVQLR